jgi:hypothetical protein
MPHGIEARGSWSLLRIDCSGRLLRSQSRSAECPILEALTQAYPEAQTKKQMAVKVGYEANGGTLQAIR